MNKKILFILKLFAVNAIFVTYLPTIVAQQYEHYYFDQDNNLVSKEKFELAARQRQFISSDFAQNDSIIHQYVVREEEGKVMGRDMEVLRDYMKKCTGKIISPNDIIAIVYYSGKNIYNKSGESKIDRAIVKMNHNNLKNAIKKMGNTSLVYLYNNKAGLENQLKFVPWHNDVDEGIEDLFFMHHVRYSSFGVINPEGDYYLFFGEHASSQITDKIKEFQNKNIIKK